MKKITFILLAFISGSAFAQTSAEASGTATVNAEIVSPIEITDGTALDFGRIIGNAAGGIVTVSAAGTRTSDNPDLLAPSTTTVQAASFKVTAADGYNYKITIPDVDLTGGGDNMTVSFDSSLGFTNIVGTGIEQDLNVGGALTVNANQAEGDYAGTVTVTVAYE